MSLAETIAADLTTALKAGERERVAVLRMLRAALQEAEVELRGKQGREARLDDADALAVLGRYARQREDSIAAFRAGNRPDLAAREQGELEVVRAYLPAPLSAAELSEEVRAAILEAGARTPADLGAVMKILQPRLRGRADGRTLSALVREALGG